MKIFANAEKKIFLEKRLEEYVETELILVQIDSPLGPAVQMEVAAKYLAAGFPVILLSLNPLSDYRHLKHYEKLIKPSKRIAVLDSSAQYSQLEKAIASLLESGAI